MLRDNDRNRGYDRGGYDSMGSDRRGDRDGNRGFDRYEPPKDRGGYDRGKQYYHPIGTGIVCGSHQKFTHIKGSAHRLFHGCYMNYLFQMIAETVIGGMALAVMGTETEEVMEGTEIEEMAVATGE